VAARAGVNETTIYRKWGTKDALLADALLTISSERLPAPDTGSLRGDLLATVGAVAAFLRTPAGYALAYLGATAQDDTSTSLRDTFWADRFQRAHVIFDRARQRGEITDTDTAALAYEALIGTLHFRILARRRPLETDIAERLVDLMLDGVSIHLNP
jgi:AcrR family transcriptional regulator